jgi:hypothetical protein
MNEKPHGEYVLQNPIEIAIAKKALELTGMDPQTADELDQLLKLYLLMQGLGQSRSMLRISQGQVGDKERQDIITSLESLIADHTTSDDDRRAAQQLLHNLRRN